jgi:hypothetical protein
MKKNYGGDGTAGTAGSDSIPDAIGWWEYFFSTDKGSAIGNVKEYFQDGWNTISSNVWTEVTENGKTISKINWDLIPTSIQKLCGDTTKTDVQKSPCFKHINKSLLALAGISLGMYLYVKLKGTKKENEIMEKRLRDARRLSEDVSDDANVKSLKRRKTGRQKAYSELSESFSSDSKSRKPKPKKKPSSKYSRRSKY